MSKQYYLSDNGTHVGPYSFDKVLSKLEGKEFQWTDYVFDEALGDWVVLLEHPEFGIHLAQKPQMPPQQVVPLNPDAMKEREWYILKEGNNYGPFSKLELIQMLQERTLFEYDYVWHMEQSVWKPISEVESFSPDSIRNLKNSAEPDVSEVFFRRRHARASYGASLIVHNNKNVFRGQALEISAGGAGVLINNASLEPGQDLFLHFQPGDGVPPFNAVCQIVSKTFVPGSGVSGEAVKYGVKFTTLSQNVRESIRNFTTKAA